MNQLDESHAAREASARRPQSEFVPVAAGLPEVLGALDRARAVYDAKKLRVLNQDCPRCDSVDRPMAKACAFLADSVCKHHGELELRARRVTREANLRAGDVPEKHWGPILAGDLDIGSSAVAAAKKMLAGEGQLAVLAGIPGSGKSFGGAFAVSERGGLFVPAAAFDTFSKQTNALISNCKRAPLTVLDDVGLGRSTSDVAIPRIEEIICVRWDRNLPTIVTANLTQEKFWKSYGGECGRIANRLQSDAIGWVFCLEESRRVAGVRP